MDIVDHVFSGNINSFLNSIDDIITVIDGKGVLLHINQAFSRITGFDPTPFIGRTLQELVDLNIIQKESCGQRAVTSKQITSMNITYYNGSTVTWTYIPVLDNRGEVAIAIGTGRDVTRLVELESEVRHSKNIISKYSQQLEELKKYLGVGNIVYSSEQMQHILRTALKIAKVDAPVLIWGETGVGKEVVAGFIHTSGKRKDKPFVMINCAAIPEELLESELFGYEEGSFTGAKKKGKMGLLEEASGGTVFLDEIGELPLKMQSKLLRFLQDGRFMRIGGHNMIEVDVRFIAATNLTQEQLMNQTSFRQDLFYRLSVIPIQIPPLRERRSDIIPLVRHFVRQFNTKYEADVSIPAKLMSRLYLYDWPGNIRELKNFVERLVILAETQEVGEEEFNIMLHLPENIRPDVSAGEAAANGTAPEAAIPVKKAIRQLEESMIRQAYAESGSILKAAKRLGIHPSTIHRKLKKESIRLR